MCLINLHKHRLAHYFWIDAICINQEDLMERNEQVLLMGPIFANASCVAAWVGSETARNSWTHAPRDQPPLEGVAALETEITEGIMGIARRRYWTRMWVVQEFLLAKRVYVLCGRCCVKWEEFKKAYNSRDRLRSGGSKVIPFIRLRDEQAFQQDMSLFELLERYRNSECEDPRDKLFGIMTLLRLEEQELLGQYFPDYRLSNEAVVALLIAYHKMKTGEYHSDSLLTKFGFVESNLEGGNEHREQIRAVAFKLDVDRYFKGQSQDASRPAMKPRVISWQQLIRSVGLTPDIETVVTFGTVRRTLSGREAGSPSIDSPSLPERADDHSVYEESDELWESGSDE